MKSASIWTDSINYHTLAQDQRFAYDFLISKNGKTFRTTGKTNKDYWCYGEPLFAPADGWVTEAVDGVHENIPGQMNPKEAAGNHVVLDHGNGEFSLLAHIQKGTVRVKKGDIVKKGAQLGLTGNNGNSSEPHLHYHLQTQSRFGIGEGLPVTFHGYVSNGALVEAGEPTQGQKLSPKNP